MVVASLLAYRAVTTRTPTVFGDDGLSTKSRSTVEGEGPVERCQLFGDLLTNDPKRN